MSTDSHRQSDPDHHSLHNYAPPPFPAHGYGAALSPAHTNAQGSSKGVEDYPLTDSSAFQAQHLPSIPNIGPNSDTPSPHERVVQPPTVPPLSGASILPTAPRPRREPSPNSCSQAILSAAWKRMGLSGSGAKSTLIARLDKKGVASYAKILELKQLYDAEGPDIAEGNGRNRAPNWTKEESARLCHVIADSRNATVVAKMYQRITTRAELDGRRHDPFAEEFRMLFNDPDFKPEPPEACGGVTLGILLRIDPSSRRNVRDGQTLKQKWTKLRSAYSAASKNFEASGQGDAEIFPSFTQGDDVLCYMHCVFHDHPSLDAVLRTIPLGSQIESGLDADKSLAPKDQNMTQSGRKRRRDETTDALAAAITSLASSRDDERPIVIQDSGSNNIAMDSQIVELDRSMKIASTVSSLMDLESKILSMIKGPLRYQL